MTPLARGCYVCRRKPEWADAKSRLIVIRGHDGMVLFGVGRGSKRSPLEVVIAPTVANAWPSERR